MLSYDVVIATKNRIEALKISIPLILNQSHAPAKLIIVDASDNYETVNRTVTEVMADSPVKLEIMNSEPNSAQQRNIGLKYVESPVVMFPDDDSLWWPGVAEAIMRIYERDENQDIIGVAADLAKSPPPQAQLINSEKRMLLKDRFRQKILGFRHKLNCKIGSDPMYILGRSFWEGRNIPGWLINENASLTEYMAGCRMSFRTDGIRSVGGFDQDLGAFVGWAAYEDAAASYAVMSKKVLVTAHNAKVCHYTFPSQRGGGFELGFINQFNRAYIICRYSPHGSASRRALKRFGCYKALQYLSSVYGQFGRGRLWGHIQALRAMKVLLESPPECLRDYYLELCQKNLKDEYQNNTLIHNVPLMR